MDGGPCKELLRRNVSPRRSEVCEVLLPNHAQDGCSEPGTEPRTGPPGEHQGFGPAKCRGAIVAFEDESTFTGDEPFVAYAHLTLVDPGRNTHDVVGDEGSHFGLAPKRGADAFALLGEKGEGHRIVHPGRVAIDVAKFFPDLVEGSRNSYGERNSGHRSVLPVSLESAVMMASRERGC